MISDQIALHSVQLPLFIKSRKHFIFVKGVPFVNRRYTKGVNGILKRKGLHPGRSLPVQNSVKYPPDPIPGHCMQILNIEVERVD